MTPWRAMPPEQALAQPRLTTAGALGFFFGAILCALAADAAALLWDAPAIGAGLAGGAAWAILAIAGQVHTAALAVIAWQQWDREQWQQMNRGPGQGPVQPSTPATGCPGMGPVPPAGRCAGCTPASCRFRNPPPLTSPDSAPDDPEVSELNDPRR